MHFASEHVIWAGLSEDNSTLLHTVSVGMAWPWLEDPLSDSLSWLANWHWVLSILVFPWSSWGFLIARSLDLKTNVARDRKYKLAISSGWAQILHTHICEILLAKVATEPTLIQGKECIGKLRNPSLYNSWPEKFLKQRNMGSGSRYLGLCELKR